MKDAINPGHYREHPSGVECITVTEHMNFNLGNAVKYIWRAGLKGDALEDLRKALWYVQREIMRLEDLRLAAKPKPHFWGRSLDELTDGELQKAMETVESSARLMLETSKVDRMAVSAEISRRRLAAEAEQR